MEWGQVLAGVIGGIIVGGFAYLGTRLTAKLSSKAATEATEVEDRRVATEEFTAIKDALNERIDSLNTRVENLEGELQAERVWRLTAVAYMRRLLQLLHEHAPHVDVPEPPAELELTLTYKPRDQS